MVTRFNEQKLKTLVKESVKEVIAPEMMRLRAFLMPSVSAKEQKDIERRYKKPTRKATKTYTINI